MTVSIQAFCETWNSSRTVQECAESLGIAYSSASDRACRLRRKGHHLKPMRVPKRPTRYTTDDLMRALHRKWRNGARRPVDRFWANVDIGGPDECWLWTGHPGTPDARGGQYGTFGITVNGRGLNFKAHRLSWAIDRKRSPKGIIVRHSCNIPLCCNPRHLTSGTQAQNVQDKLDSGRQYAGEDHHSCKLTPDDVNAIRASDKPTPAMAREYGVHYTTIFKIRKGKTWKTVTIQ
jgi:hypothetical protein